MKSYSKYTKNTKSTKGKQTISISLNVFVCSKNCCLCFLFAYFCFVSLFLLVYLFLLVCFCLWLFLCVWNFLVKKINRPKIVLMTSFTRTTNLPPPKNFLAIFADFEQSNTPFGETLWLRDAMPCHWSLCFLVSPCYLQDPMPYQWSSGDLSWVLQIWESVFYSQAFFTLHTFLLVLRLPCELVVQPQGLQGFMLIFEL